jgi:hypothetical protein
MDITKSTKICSTAVFCNGLSFKGTVSRKSWRDKAIVSKSRLQLRIATGFKIFLIGPLNPVIFQSFHFA